MELAKDHINVSSSWIYPAEITQITRFTIPWMALSSQGNRFLKITRAGTHIFSLHQQIKKDVQNHKWLTLPYHSCEIIFQISSLATLVFSPKLYVKFSIATKGVKLIKLTVHLGKHLAHAQVFEAFTDLVKITTTSTLLTAQLYPTPLLIMLSLIIKAGKQFHKAHVAIARQDATPLDHIEALSFASLGYLRTNQIHP